MNSKGFLFTILTILIATSLIALASFFALEGTNRDLSAEKVSNVFDDIGSDVEDLLGLSASVERSPGFITVSFDDRFPLSGGASAVGEYEDFIETDYAQALGSEVTLSGFSDPFFTVEPYGLIYGYPSFDKKKVWFYNESGDAVSVEKYVVELDFDENLLNVVNQSAAGDLDVVVNARFANTVYSQSLSVARDGSSSWSFNLMDCNCSVSLSFGRNVIGGGARDSSFVAEASGDVDGEMRTDVVLGELNESVGVASSIYLRFKNKVTREDYIWLKELR